MPELPEVEVLVRHLASLLKNRAVRKVNVFRAKILAPTPLPEFQKRLRGACFTGLTRRGKYLLFSLESADCHERFTLLGHLGLTGRIFLARARAPRPRHAAVVLDLGAENLVFEDTRYFGRLTLEPSAVARLGPEPLGREFTVEGFARALGRSTQPVKVKLLDQTVVAGIGNIYASEALFRARISPERPARALRRDQVARLRRAIREVLARAIKNGSTVPLNFGAAGLRDGLFYFGRAPGTPDYYEERLWVYDRAGEPCRTCKSMIKRIVQAARSTYYCPRCQPPR